MKKLFIYFIIFTLTACMGESVDPITGGNSMDSSSPGGGGTGTGGSLARFTIAGNNLFIVTSNTLYSFSLDNPAKPELMSNLAINNIVETIFALGDHLLLGTQSGMLIYSISNPDNPVYTSFYQHVVSCDPVVARGNYAYATLRVEGSCSRGVNQLDVINISNIQNPFGVNELVMNNPKGLGISGDNLYICDNNKLIRLNISNPAYPIKSNMSYLLPGCFDVIPYNNTLIVASTEGIHQFAIDEEGDLNLLSTINKD